MTSNNQPQGARVAFYTYSFLSCHWNLSNSGQLICQHFCRI